MALKLWASSAASALKVSLIATTTSPSPAFSIARCFSSATLRAHFLHILAKLIFVKQCQLRFLVDLIAVIEGLKYSHSHEWVKHEGSVATIGITDHTQGHLGEVVFVELPESGTTVSKGGSFGVVESVKATSDISSAVSGQVIEVNTKLTESPGLINSSPYEEGWMIKVQPSNPAELESSIGAKQYTKFCEEEDAHH